MEKIAESLIFAGHYRRYRHTSQVTGTPMNLGIFLPPLTEKQHVPCLLWLSGLTCTDENFAHKAGAFRLASSLGMAILCPDTSPRGLDLPGEHDSYDFGSGAGFYLDATVKPWSDHYRMYSYITEELIPLCESHFPLNGQWSISGHSMGGHGALTIGIRNPDQFASISAFAPICHPSTSPWGQKAFQGYLKSDEEWGVYDTLSLLTTTPVTTPILIDQGSEDQFLTEQLGFASLQKLHQERKLGMELRLQQGYDHSYYFIATFIDDHLKFHSQFLQ